MENFDQKAKDWDKQKRRHDRACYVANQIKEKLSTSGKALEFGAGTGLLGFKLLDQVEKMSFFDTSRGMLDVIEEKAKGMAKVEVLDKLSGTFDLIFNVMVMHHIPDIKKQIIEFYNMLEEEGEVFIYDLDTEDGSFHGDLDLHHGIDRDLLINYLREAGFSQVEVYDSFTVEKHGRSYTAFLAKGKKK